LLNLMVIFYEELTKLWPTTNKGLSGKWSPP
jgi:hypothetical protein